jgi:hypothetical protein
LYIRCFIKISKVEALAISIPLRAAVSDAVRRITHRDHLIVRITTADGLSGEGFTLGYDGSKAMVPLVDTIFRPMLEGASAFDSEHLWAELYRQSIQAGLLGVHSTRLRCYATGGYYRDNDDRRPRTRIRGLRRTRLHRRQTESRQAPGTRGRRTAGRDSQGAR